MNNAIEMVQHDAARFITHIYMRKGNFQKYSITKILKDLDFDTLEKRRTKAKLLMAYKIINGKVILDSNLLPRVFSQRPMRQCNFAKVGNEYQLKEPSPRLQVTKNTFFYSVPEMWNHLVTPAQAKAPSIEAFKAHMSKS